jgi:hypothetical protein
MNAHQRRLVRRANLRKVVKRPGNEVLQRLLNEPRTSDKPHKAWLLRALAQMMPMESKKAK